MSGSRNGQLFLAVARRNFSIFNSHRVLSATRHLAAQRPISRSYILRLPVGYVHASKVAFVGAGPRGPSEAWAGEYDRRVCMAHDHSAARGRRHVSRAAPSTGLLSMALYSARCGVLGATLAGLACCLTGNFRVAGHSIGRRDYDSMSDLAMSKLRS